MPSELWHEPPNSTDRIKKMNHRSGRYAVWGREENGQRIWQVMEGQGPQARVASRESFRSCDEAMNAAERLIHENEASNRGTRAKAP